MLNKFNETRFHWVLLAIVGPIVTVIYLTGWDLR